MAVEEKTTVNLQLKIDETVHESMKELSKRKRVQLAVVYEEAAILYLNQEENYMGENRRPPAIQKERRSST